MRKLIILLLLLTAISGAQTTSFDTDRAVGTFPVGSGSAKIAALIPIQYGQVRVCTLPLTQQQPCLPLASITDINSNPVSNSIGGAFGQITTDVTGRFTFGCQVNLNYQIQIAPSSSNVPQLNYPITCPGTGAAPSFTTITTQKLNNIFWAGPGATLTIDQQLTACGTNPCLVIVDPAYTGPQRTLAVPFEKGQVVWDLHAPGTINSDTPSGFNTVTYGSQDASVVSMIRSAFLPASPLASKSYEAFTFTAGYTGTMPNSPQSIEGITSECFTYGAVTTPSTTDCLGLEGNATVESTGGGLRFLLGLQAEASTAAASTTTVITMASIRGYPPAKGGTGAITNAYAGWFTSPGSTVGNTRNYALFSQGPFLLTGIADTGDAANFDVADHTGTAQHFIQMASPSDNIIINGIGGAVQLNNKAGVVAWTWTSPNFQFDPGAAGLSIQYGTGGARILTATGDFQPLKVGAFNNINTAGAVGVPPIYGATLQKAETGTADTNVLTFTPPAAAGTYRVCVAISVSSATAGVIGWTLTWTDSSGNSQAPGQAQALFQQGTAAPALTYTVSAAGNYQSCSMIDVNNAAASIVVKWVGGGTTAAKMSATIERVQ